jgi:hypothetical protein
VISVDWIHDLAFVVDLTTYLNELNLYLLGENQLICQLHSNVRTVQAKHGLWGTKLRSCSAFCLASQHMITVLLVMDCAH